MREAGEVEVPGPLQGGLLASSLQPTDRLSSLKREGGLPL